MLKWAHLQYLWLFTLHGMRQAGDRSALIHEQWLIENGWSGTQQ